MQPHHQINHINIFQLIVFNIVNLASSYSTLPGDGEYTETCWSCFSVNFNTPFKAILLYIKIQGKTVKKGMFQAI
jgi:hypothetical protein